MLIWEDRSVFYLFHKSSNFLKILLVQRRAADLIFSCECHALCINRLFPTPGWRPMILEYSPWFSWSSPAHLSHSFWCVLFPLEFWGTRTLKDEDHSNCTCCVVDSLWLWSFSFTSPRCGWGSWMSYKTKKQGCFSASSTAFDFTWCYFVITSTCLYFSFLCHRCCEPAEDADLSVQKLPFICLKRGFNSERPAHTWTDRQTDRGACLRECSHRACVFV